jgi:hypothetical protein
MFASWGQRYAKSTLFVKRVLRRPNFAAVQRHHPASHEMQTALKAKMWPVIRNFAFLDLWVLQ